MMMVVQQSEPQSPDDEAEWYALPQGTRICYRDDKQSYPKPPSFWRYFIPISILLGIGGLLSWLLGEASPAFITAICGGTALLLTHTFYGSARTEYYQGLKWEDDRKNVYRLRAPERFLPLRRNQWLEANWWQDEEERIQREVEGYKLDKIDERFSVQLTGYKQGDSLEIILPDTAQRWLIHPAR